MHLALAYCGNNVLSGLENNNKELEKDNSKWLKIVQTELADWDFSDWIKSVWEEMWQIPRNIITGMEKVKRIDCSNTKDKEHGLKLEGSKQSYFFNVNEPVKSSPQDAMTWKISEQVLGKVCPRNRKTKQPAPGLQKIQQLGVCSGKCHCLWIFLLYMSLSPRSTQMDPGMIQHTCLCFWD